MPEESKVIYQNWCTLQQHALFTPIPQLLKKVSIQLSSNLLTVTLGVIEQQMNAYLKFEHIVPLTGILGLLVVLQETHSLEDNTLVQRCLRLIHGASHLENLYGFINISQCECLFNLVGWGEAPVKNTRKRLKSKKKYIHRMNELIVLLNSLPSHYSKLTPQLVISYLREAFILIQRFFQFYVLFVGVGMSLESFLFIKNNRPSEMKSKMWGFVMNLQLLHYHLQRAVFHNPAVKRLLPLLVMTQLNSIATELDSPSITAEFVNEHLFDEDCLLWLSLTGCEDITKDKLNDRIHEYFVLQHVIHSYQKQYSLMEPSPMLFFNIQHLGNFLQQTLEATQIKHLITTYMTVLNEDSRLFNSVCSPRKEYCCLSSIRNRVLKQGYFLSFYHSIFDYLITVIRKDTDNIIRTRVFLSDCLVPSEASQTSITTEKNLTTMKALVKMPPISVMGVSLDVDMNWFIHSSLNISSPCCIARIITTFLCRPARHSFFMISSLHISPLSMIWS